MEEWLNKITDNKSTSENRSVNSTSKSESGSEDMKIVKCLRK